MKDKEKQIEEMAYICCKLSNKPLSCSTCMWRKSCDSYENATKYIEQDYRNCKDSVVLSKDNYNRLKQDSDLFEELLKNKVHLETVIELSNAQYEKVLEKNKSLLRLISLIDDLPEESLLDLDKWIEAIKAKASKETAEKFVNLPDSDVLVVDTQEYGEIEVVSVERLQELAKHFGVEIKE